MRETLEMAIENLNNNAHYGLRIKSDTKIYKIKLSKKTGLPDLDLPALSYDLKLLETTEKVFSVVVEESNISYIDQSMVNLEIEQPSANKNINKQEIKQVEQKSKGCCFCF